MSARPALKKLGKNAPPKKVLQQIGLLQSMGRFKESKPLCDRMADLGLTHPDFLHLHGLALRACDDLTGALVKIHAAHEQRPKDVQIINSLAVIFLQMNDVETAIELFKRATEIDQNYFDGWKNLGIALKKAERYQAAELALTAAYRLDPTQIEPLLNLVDILIEVRSYERAEEFMDKLLARQQEISPELQVRRLRIAARLEDFDYIVKHRETADLSNWSQDEKAALDNIWVFYLDVKGRYDEAIALLERWAEVDTPYKAQLQSQLGMLYALVGRIDDAITVHKDQLRLAPDHVAVRYNLAALQFRNGDLDEAYDNYEARWLWREFPTRRRLFSSPRWEGQPLDGKKLLVWKEQGIGDEVRFASLLPELKDLGGSVTFECSPKLIPLFELSFPWATIRAEGPLECRGDEDYAEFDYQIPVGSLGKFFRPAVEDFAKKQVATLKRFPDDEKRIRTQLGIGPDELLVGVCWRSQNRASSRDRYFFDCEQLVPLKQLPNTKWLNVQYDAEADEIETMRKQGLQVSHYGNVDQKNDIVTACKLFGACDLVISIGGSVADLAGCLGVPMIYITNNNSEVFLGTDHVPWFPEAKSFPILPNRGDDVIADIIGQWPSIAEWAKGIAGSREDVPASAEAPDLDLEYDFSSAG